MPSAEVRQVFIFVWLIGTGFVLDRGYDGGTRGEGWTNEDRHRKEYGAEK